MSTNYRSTFIAVALDCPVQVPTVPTLNTERPTVAALQFELISERPYALTSDDILFAVHARRSGISEEGLDAARQRFLAKDQACLRASPLSKRWGWGTHHDAHSRVALVGVGTAEYESLVSSAELTQKSALRSSRA